MAYDYDSIPKSWTIQSLVQGLNVTKEALKPLLTDIKDFFDHNSDIIELRTYASQDRISAEANVLRAKHSSLFANVPPDTKFDTEVAEGCMKCIFNSRNTLKSRMKRETPVSSITPAPSATPALSSPNQSITRAYSTPISTLLPEIPEHRLIIEFSRPCSQNVPRFETPPELLVLRNPSRSSTSAIRLTDVTRAVIVELLLEENIMTSQEESIWGVREDREDMLLSSTSRVVGYLQARCQAGTPRASIYITPVVPTPPSPSQIQSRPLEGTPALSHSQTAPAPTLGKRALDEGSDVQVKEKPRGRRRELSLRRKHKSSVPKSATTPFRPTSHHSSDDESDSVKIFSLNHPRKRARLGDRRLPRSSEDEWSNKESPSRESSVDETHKISIDKSKVHDDSPAEDEFGADADIIGDEDEDDNTRQASWQWRLDEQLNSPAIEQMASLENWELACRLIGMDPIKTTTQPCIQVPALKEKLNQYQFFAIVLFHIWARNGQNGGFLADGMGLGKTLQALGVIVFENLLHHNYQVVTACQHSEDPHEKSKHRNKDGTGECKGAPLFFKQCVCDPHSDLRKTFSPKEGFSLVILPQTIIPVWQKEYLKFYDPTVSAIQLKLRIAHGKHGKRYTLTSEEVEELKCEYPREVIASTQGRLYRAVEETAWRYKGVPQEGSHRFIIITTPGSYEAHVYTPISYQYKWSCDPDPPLTGPGSKTPVKWVYTRIPGVLPAWIVVDEFHEQKSMAKNHGPWEHIMNMRKCARGFPSLIAMSGTPVSIGPADITGPLQCLTGDQQVIKELDQMNTKFKQLLQQNPRSQDMMNLISSFGALYRPLTIRRTENSSWFGDKILDLPPLHQKDIDVQFPAEYRPYLEAMTNRIATAAQQSDIAQTNQKFMLKIFLRTVTRQQLLVSTLPWLAWFWGQSDENREERLLAGEYPQRHLDRHGNWSRSNIFRTMGDPYNNDIPLPKYRALDRILKQACKEGSKMLVFSQFIAIASFTQHYIHNHPKYPMPARLFHSNLSETVKEQLVSGFQGERVSGPDSPFRVEEEELRPQVLCGTQSALGTGLNLFAGNVCVFMEPYPQPAHAKQALKRLHRRGQTKEVYVFRLTCAGEHDGVLAERVHLKRATTRDMFAEGIFGANPHGDDDIQPGSEEEFEGEEGV